MLFKLGHCQVSTLGLWRLLLSIAAGCGRLLWRQRDGGFDQACRHMRAGSSTPLLVLVVAWPRSLRHGVWLVAVRRPIMAVAMSWMLRVSLPLLLLAIPLQWLHTMLAYNLAPRFPTRPKMSMDGCHFYSHAVGNTPTNLHVPPTRNSVCVVPRTNTLSAQKGLEKAPGRQEVAG